MDLFHVAVLAILGAGLLFIMGAGLLGKKARGTVTQSESALTGAWRTVTTPGQTDRTPGQVLDSMWADLHWIKTHTDAPPEAIKALESVAGYLMHDKGTAPVVSSVGQPLVQQGA